MERYSDVSVGVPLRYVNSGMGMYFESSGVSWSCKSRLRVLGSSVRPRGGKMSTPPRYVTEG